MGWAAKHIEQLINGETVKFRPVGGSMAGIIDSGNLVTVEPLAEGYRLAPGDVVLCCVGNAEYLHLIKKTNCQNGSFLIGNNKGGVNGLTPRSKIYGRCVKVEP